MRAQVARHSHVEPSLSGPQVGNAADRPGGGDWAWEVAAHQVGPGRRPRVGDGRAPRTAGSRTRLRTPRGVVPASGPKGRDRIVRAPQTAFKHIGHGLPDRISLIGS